MNKQTFLAQLESALAVLSPEERQDILRDMEEYFHEAMGRGLTEEAIVKKLGSPKALSETIIAEAKVKRITTATTIPSKVKAVCAALLAIIVLTPFNLIFVLLPLLLATLFIVIGWPIVIVIAILLPIIWLACLVLAVYVGFKLFALLAIFFFALGWLGLVGAVLVGFAFLTVLYFKGIAKLFQWNIQFIKNRMKG